MSELKYILNFGSSDARRELLELAFKYINRSKTCQYGGTTHVGFRDRYFNAERDWSKGWWGSLGTRYFGERINPNLYHEQTGVLIAGAFQYWVNFTAFSIAKVQKTKQGCRTRTNYLLGLARQTLAFTIEHHQMSISGSFVEEMENFFQKCSLFHDRISPVILTKERMYPECNDTLREGTAFFFITKTPDTFL